MTLNQAPKSITTCTNCGALMPPPKSTGRPKIYCSDRCRKAAFDARRARKPGAFEVKVVEKAVVQEHDLSECVARVVTSPGACRRVLRALTELARDRTLTDDAKWDATNTAARGLANALYAPRR